MPAYGERAGTRFRRKRAEGEKREAKPLLVGVADLGVIFYKYSRKDDLEKEINAKINPKRDKFDGEAREQTAELDALKAKIRAAAAAEKPNLEAELRWKVADFKAVRDGWEAQLKADVERVLIPVLDEVGPRSARTERNAVSTSS